MSSSGISEWLYLRIGLCPNTCIMPELGFSNYHYQSIRRNPVNALITAGIIYCMSLISQYSHRL